MMLRSAVRPRGAVAGVLLVLMLAPMLVAAFPANCEQELCMMCVGSTCGDSDEPCGWCAYAEVTPMGVEVTGECGVQEQACLENNGVYVTNLFWCVEPTPRIEDLAHDTSDACRDLDAPSCEAAEACYLWDFNRARGLTRNNTAGNMLACLDWPYADLDEFAADHVFSQQMANITRDLSTTREAWGTPLWEGEHVNCAAAHTCDECNRHPECGWCDRGARDYGYCLPVYPTDPPAPAPPAPTPNNGTMNHTMGNNGTMGAHNGTMGGNNGTMSNGTAWANSTASSNTTTTSNTTTSGNDTQARSVHMSHPKESLVSVHEWERRRLSTLTDKYKRWKVHQRRPQTVEQLRARRLAHTHLQARGDTPTPTSFWQDYCVEVSVDWGLDHTATVVTTCPADDKCANRTRPMGDEEGCNACVSAGCTFCGMADAGGVCFGEDTSCNGAHFGSFSLTHLTNCTVEQECSWCERYDTCVPPFLACMCDAVQFAGWTVEAPLRVPSNFSGDNVLPLYVSTTDATFPRAFLPELTLSVCGGSDMCAPNKHLSLGGGNAWETNVRTPYRGIVSMEMWMDVKQRYGQFLSGMFPGSDAPGEIPLALEHTTVVGFAPWEVSSFVVQDLSANTPVTISIEAEDVLFREVIKQAALSHTHVRLNTSSMWSDAVVVPGPIPRDTSPNGGMVWTMHMEPVLADFVDNTTVIDGLHVWQEFHHDPAFFQRSVEVCTVMNSECGDACGKSQYFGTCAGTGKECYLANKCHWNTNFTIALSVDRPTAGVPFEVWVAPNGDERFSPEATPRAMWWVSSTEHPYLNYTNSADTGAPHLFQEGWVLQGEGSHELCVRIEGDPQLFPLEQYDSRGAYLVRCRDVEVDAACVPECGGYTCGSDGCGGSCGSCGVGAYCDLTDQVCVNVTNPDFHVQVADKTRAHPAFGEGSPLGYEVNGVEGRELIFMHGKVYSFLANMTCQNPLYLTTSPVGDGANEFTTNVIGSRACDGSLLTVSVDADFPEVLYYQSYERPNMGWRIVVRSPCPNGCSGHGACDVVSGECTCAAHWCGSDCSLHAMSEPTITVLPSSDGLRVWFSHPVTMAGGAVEFACSDLFTGADNSSVPEDFTCMWEDSRNVIVRFNTDDDTRYPSVGMWLHVRSGALAPYGEGVDNRDCPTMYYDTYEVRKPQGEVVRGFIEAPARASSCDSVTYAVRLSTGDVGTVWVDWFLMGDHELELRTLFANATGREVTVPARLLPVNGKLMGYALVRNWVVKSDDDDVAPKFMFATDIASTVLPVPRIGSGEPKRTHARSQDLVLEASVAASSCRTPGPANYRWEAWGEHEVPITSDARNKRVLRVPAYSLGAVSELSLDDPVVYQVRLIAWYGDQREANNSATVTIEVPRASVDVTIEGGSRRTVGSEQMISLTASASNADNDPTDDESGSADFLPQTTWAWWCRVVSAPGVEADSACFASELEGVTTRKMSVSAARLAPGRYAFHTRATQIARLGGEVRYEGTTSTEVEVLQGAPPQVSIATAGVINTGRPIRLQGAAMRKDNRTAATWAWTLEAPAGALDLTDRTVLGVPSASGKLLVIKAAALEAGVTYEFKLTITDENGEGFAFAQVRVNEPPRGGVVSAAPSWGYAMHTPFTFGCTKWSDDDEPLEYAFAVSRDNGASYTPLGDWSASSTYSSAHVPSGKSAHDHLVRVRCQARDRLGAMAWTSAHAVTRVLPPANKTVDDLRADFDDEVQTLRDNNDANGVLTYIVTAAAGATDNGDAGREFRGEMLREAGAVLADLPRTSGTAAQVMGMLREVTGAELNGDAAIEAAKVMRGMLEHVGGDNVDTDTVRGLLAVADNVLINAEARVRNNRTRGRELVDTLGGAMEDLGKQRLEQLSCGEDAETIMSGDVVLNTAKREKGDIEKLDVGGIPVTVPAGALGDVAGSCVEVRANKLPPSYYSWLDRGDKVVDGVLQLELSEDGNEVTVQDAPEPIMFKVDVMGTASVNYSCWFFDETLEEFSYEGCTLHNVTGNAVHCSCTHTTDYVLLNVAAPPSVPYNVGVGTLTPTTMQIEWDAADENGAAVDAYELTLSGGAAPVLTSNLAYTFSDLTGNTEYTVDVRAQNSAGWGPSTSVVATTTTAVPERVTGLTATAQQPTVINLAWTAPADNGAAITEYNVQRAVGASGAMETVGQSSSTSYVDNNVAEGVLHRYRVAAVNSVGMGEYSESVSETTPTVCSQYKSCDDCTLRVACGWCSSGETTGTCTDGGETVAESVCKADLWSYGDCSNAGKSDNTLVIVAATLGGAAGLVLLFVMFKLYKRSSLGAKIATRKGMDEGGVEMGMAYDDRRGDGYEYGADEYDGGDRYGDDYGQSYRKDTGYDDGYDDRYDERGGGGGGGGRDEYYDDYGDTYGKPSPDPYYSQPSYGAEEPRAYDDYDAQGGDPYDDYGYSESYNDTRGGAGYADAGADPYDQGYGDGYDNYDQGGGGGGGGYPDDPYNGGGGGGYDDHYNRPNTYDDEYSYGQDDPYATNDYYGSEQNNTSHW